VTQVVGEATTFHLSEPPTQKKSGWESQVEQRFSSPLRPSPIRDLNGQAHFISALFFLLSPKSKNGMLSDRQNCFASQGDMGLF